MKQKLIITGVTALVLGAGIGLAACGSSNKTSTASTTGASTTTMANKPAAHNDADVTFTQGMIPHHQQAVTMAKLATTRASDPRVKDLASRIQGAQDPEIKQLQGFLTSFGVMASTDTTMAGMDHGTTAGMDNMSANGMASDADLKKLADSTGADFDKLFVQLMTAHHQGAVAMAQMEIKGGEYQPAKGLAQKIINAQTAEINEMKGFGL